MNLESSLPAKTGSYHAPSLPKCEARSVREEKSPLKVKFSSFVKAFDLTPVKYKLVKEQDWTLERAELVEAQYKAFLFLLGTKDGRFFVPTLDIDEMWHTHILDTRKYMDDCASLFGEYIHHYPYLGLKDGEDEVRAKKLFAETCETLLSDLDIDVHALKFSCCGGGGSGGGGGCTGGGCTAGHCGTGHSDSGHSHHDSGYVPYNPVTNCGSGSSDSSRKRRRPEPSKKPSYTPPGRPSETPKRGWISRILGLSPAAAEKWFASVTPQDFSRNEYRPGAEALAALVVEKERILN